MSVVMRIIPGGLLAGVLLWFIARCAVSDAGQGPVWVVDGSVVAAAPAADAEAFVRSALTPCDTNTVVISGAGTAAMNGTYTNAANVYYLVGAPSKRLNWAVGPPWQWNMVDLSVPYTYYSTAASGVPTPVPPTNTWSSAGAAGTNPAPSAAFAVHYTNAVASDDPKLVGLPVAPWPTAGASNSVLFAATNAGAFATVTNVVLWFRGTLNGTGTVYCVDQGTNFHVRLW